MKKFLVELGNCLLFLLIVDLIGIKIDQASYFVGATTMFIAMFIGELVDNGI